jgi:hypothetical protein
MFLTQNFSRKEKMKVFLDSVLNHNVVSQLFMISLRLCVRKPGVSILSLARPQLLFG